MERTSFKTKLLGRLVIYTALGIILYGALAHFHSPHARALAEREGSAINLFIMTDKPMFINYDPQHRKALVTNIEKGVKITASKSGLLYIKPKTQDRAEFWEMSKANLRAWHKKPWLILAYIYNYAQLRASGRTNITIADFIMISMDIMRLEPGDFTVKNPPPPATKSRNAPRQVIIAQEQRPQTQYKTIVLEILNASGRAGMAADATRYLRDLSNRGIIDIDVINHATFSKLQEKSQIIDINGCNPEDLKQLARRLGMENNEIFIAPDKMSIADVKIILGKDFVLPKDK